MALILSGLLAAAGSAADADELLLRQAGIPTDNAGVIDYLRQSTGTAGQNVAQLIEQLGDDRFERREDASRQLLALGLPALADLQRAATDADKERARRAEDCLRVLDKPDGWLLATAALRLLIRRQPEGTAEILIRCLPTAALDADFEAEVAFALDRIARQDPAVRRGLAAVLRDPAPSRRALAALILGHHGEEREVVRQLLVDSQPSVRLRAAQGLLAGGDQAGVSTLLALLVDGTVYDAWQAEELLHCLAGEAAPPDYIGAGKPESRRRCRDAWQAWWQAEERRRDVTAHRRIAAQPRLILISWHESTRNGESTKEDGEIALYGQNGKLRWRLAPGALADFQLLPGGTLLGAEANLLTERNLAGQLVWSQELDCDPYTCRQLPTGKRFAAGWPHHIRINEIDRTGKVAPLPALDGVAGAISIQVEMMPTSRLFFCALTWRRGFDDYKSSYGEADPRTGKLLWRAEVNGSIYLRQATHGQVFRRIGRQESIELDRLGKELRTYHASEVIRLVNGNVLLSRSSADQPVYIAELTPDDRVAWEMLSRREPQRFRDPFPMLRLGFDLSPRWDLSRAEKRAQQLLALDREVRAHAIRQLATARPPDYAAAALLYALDDADEDNRSEAAVSLGRLGVSASIALEHGLRDRRPHVRYGALLAIQHHRGPAAGLVGAILPLIQDPSQLVRGQAAATLGQFPASAQAAQALGIAAIQDTDADVRKTALNALGRFQDQADQILPTLVRALDDPEPANRACAANWLGILASPDHHLATAALIRAMDDRESEVRAMAAWGLGTRRGQAGQVVPALVKGLKDSDMQVIHHAAAGLGRLGPAAAPALPELVDMLQSRDRQLRHLALHSMHHLGRAAAPALPLLLDGLQEDDYREQQEKIIRVVGGIGPAAAPSVPLLLKLLQEQPADSAVIVEALGNIGTGAKAAIPVLIDFLKDTTSNSLAADAATALGRMGAAAKDALPALHKAKEKHPDDDARFSARRAAIKIEQAIYLKRPGTNHH